MENVYTPSYDRSPIPAGILGPGEPRARQHYAEGGTVASRIGNDLAAFLDAQPGSQPAAFVFTTWRQGVGPWFCARRADHPS